MPDQILVLVVEDEEMVRVMITEVLRDEGFEVMEAEHAEAALGMLLTHAPAFMSCLPTFKCQEQWTVWP